MFQRHFNWHRFQLWTFVLLFSVVGCGESSQRLPGQQTVPQRTEQVHSGASKADAGVTPYDGAAGGRDQGASGDREDAEASSERDAEGHVVTTGKGCFGAGERPPTVEPNGLLVPDLAAEKAAYRQWGWTWDKKVEPNAPADPLFTVFDPDIHNGSEADDLWNNLMMYERTKQQGYLDRAKAWARYFKEDFRACKGSKYSTLCFDRDGHGLDHLWGWGLVSWYKAMGDQAALDEAERLAEMAEKLYYAQPQGGSVKVAWTNYGLRHAGRHLILVSRLAEVTKKARWAKLRDEIVMRVLDSPYWDDQYGMYFVWETTLDAVRGAGSYYAGWRGQSAFMIGVFIEALDHVYRTAGNEKLRERMVAMARFVDKYGLDPKYQYTASYFGVNVNDGRPYHKYSRDGTATYWDPVYTISLVNTLMRGYRYTCERRFYDRAKYFFERGNKGLYGEPVKRAAPDNVVHHFVDSVFDSTTRNLFFAYNKGELQYTYLLFDPAALGVGP